MHLIREPLLTYEMARQDLELDEQSTYIHRSSAEDRSLLDNDWHHDMVSRGVTFIHVESEDLDSIVISGLQTGPALSSYRLRDKNSLLELGRSFGKVYLDITGMSYSTWAPLLRALIEVSEDCCVVYVEPADYRRSETPSSGMIYDLSESISGIAPLPGFASLRRRRQEDWCLVPLLGFEGARLAHVLETTEPPADRVVPIIGVPGFRLEFATQALVANRLSLEDDFLFRHLRYAKANCPFDLFHELHRLQDEYPQITLRIAPVGTKPHGLGAVLFAMSRPNSVEIVYDHPRRKSKRTGGAARVCLYEVGVFTQSSIYRGRAAL